MTKAASSKQNHLPDLFLASSNNLVSGKQASKTSPGQKHLAKINPPPHSKNSPSVNLFDLLPQVPISNSALVHQRAASLNKQPSTQSVGDHLAVASAQTGASLPLMIGNRAKCVVNLAEQQQPPDNNTNNKPSGPQNTALRAEQRRQNMSAAAVSVVRPVVMVSGVASCAETNSCPRQSRSSNSLIDDWMNFDRKYANTETGGGTSPGTIDELLGSIARQPRSEFDLSRTDLVGAQMNPRPDQLALIRREQHELDRALVRQHEFVVSKLEERKRQLSIVQSVWFQRDLKHAVETLVDLYHQGLVFAPDGRHQAARLRSLNTSLVVDFIGIIILRPKLWTLEICQLLLPIINQDLLEQASGRQFEYYLEIGFKALKLILTHFSLIISSTLTSLKDADKLIGVDLSREERINRCLACYKLLLESQSVLASQLKIQNKVDFEGKQCKLIGFQSELQQMFSSFFNSVQLDSSKLARNSCG